MNTISPKNKKKKMFDVVSKIVVANEEVKNVELIEYQIQKAYGNVDITKFLNNDHIKVFYPNSDYKKYIKSKYNILKSNNEK